MRRTDFLMPRTLLVLSTFSLGTLITFGCALLYSVRQQGAPIRETSNAALKKAGGRHLENRSSSDGLAKDAEKKITEQLTFPARNSQMDPTTPGPEQSGGEPLRSELTDPHVGAVSNAAPQWFSSKMPSMVNGNSAPSRSIGPLEVETTSQAAEQQFTPAIGTGGSLKPETPDEPTLGAESPHVSSFVPEEKKAAPDPERSVITSVDRGTSVQVRLADALSSDRNRTGDSFQALLATPLVANGSVLAAEGSTVFGRIVDVHRGRLLGGRGWLTLTLACIKFPDGRIVQINTTRVQRSIAENPIIATTKIIRGAALGTVKGAFSGAAQGAGFAPNTLRENPENSTGSGRVAVLPAGTEISFNLTAPVTLTAGANR